MRLVQRLRASHHWDDVVDADLQRLRDRVQQLEAELEQCAHRQRGLHDRQQRDEHRDLNRHLVLLNERRIDLQARVRAAFRPAATAPSTAGSLSSSAASQRALVLAASTPLPAAAHVNNNSIYGRYRQIDVQRGPPSAQSPQPQQDEQRPASQFSDRSQQRG